MCNHSIICTLPFSKKLTKEGERGGGKGEGKEN